MKLSVLSGYVLHHWRRLRLGATMNLDRNKTREYERVGEVERESQSVMDIVAGDATSDSNVSYT